MHGYSTLSVTHLALGRNMGVTECENCGAELAPLDKVVVWRKEKRADLGNGYMQVRGCERCADEAISEEYKRRGFSVWRYGDRLRRGNPVSVRYATCHHCGREVGFVTETEYRGPYARRAYCSD